MNASFKTGGARSWELTGEVDERGYARVERSAGDGVRTFHYGHPDSLVGLDPEAEQFLQSCRAAKYLIDRERAQAFLDGRRAALDE